VRADEVLDRVVAQERREQDRDRRQSGDPVTAARFGDANIPIETPLRNSTAANAG